MAERSPVRTTVIVARAPFSVAAKALALIRSSVSTICTAAVAMPPIVGL